MSRPLVDCSIVVSVKNDAESLSRLLAALSNQTVIPFQVCLVIAKSDDETEAIAHDWKLPHSQVQVLPMEATATRSQARNLGASRTTGSVLVFTDAGCLPEVFWLEELLRPFEEDAHLVSGLTLAEEVSAWDEAQARFVLVNPTQIEEHPHPATRNMAISRSAWEASGGFRSHLNFAEDYEFARRVRSQGLISTFASRAVVYWKPRESFSSFFSMILRLTAGDVQAGNIRFGVVTMWIRYVFMTLFSLWCLFNVGMFRAVCALVALFLLYSVLKQRKWHGLSPQARFWAFPLQLVSDVAVLSGSLLGLAWRKRNEENTQ